MYYNLMTTLTYDYLFTRSVDQVFAIFASDKIMFPNRRAMLYSVSCKTDQNLQLESQTGTGTNCRSDVHLP